ncbi:MULTISPECIES: PH domain-containing protein [Priestia]|uniref:PH domain-containing protein n=1 Tax=Priestia TaxID=2800373 RepID=UPI001C8D4701|nr:MULTISPECIES: PH domain-containing protein [Priestia]MBX9986840.1 PH domain-containing protein [Priestia aryabhattai]MBX9999275.1 PH domain-containing protein [Priestia aryabhattai]MDG0059665.1 PH domain-containing protein [Priestia sp. P5]UYV55146.1 PH domain-containing protein [Priestia megaterium]
MGILDGLLGNASEADIRGTEKDLQNILIANERVEQAYKVIRDLMVFTTKRLIIVDKQGVTGKKTDYHSIPYKTITHFSVETAGTFDLDAELNIWVSGSSAPISKEFRKDKSIYDVQKILASYVLD